ncbi:hypothetical protein [Acetobacter sp.]|uniref:hypothetical protein n=1 Tax=Acetobacter sp. TaxID=440 RepID=UPI0039E82DEE
MSAFTRLWRRAPLWRLSLIGMVACGGLTALYPPHWLVNLYPPIGKLVHHAPPASSGEGEEQGSAGDGGSAPASGGSNDYRSGQAAAPPIDADLRDVIPLAGRQFPLPVGIWHPVLTEQNGPHGEIVSNVYVRTDRGVVTGVILVRATTVSIPANLSSVPHPSCDREEGILFRRVLPSPPGTTECVMTNVTQPPMGEAASREDIDWAFHRLVLLGFPMPPVLVQGIWVHTVRDPTGDGQNFETMAIALSPADPGTTHIKASMDDWTPEGIGASPFAGRFVNDVNNWMLKWAPVLQQGYQGKLQPSTETVRPGSADPAWHGTGDRPPT